MNELASTTLAHPSEDIETRLMSCGSKLPQASRDTTSRGSSPTPGLNPAASKTRPVNPKKLRSQAVRAPLNSGDTRGSACAGICRKLLTGIGRETDDVGPGVGGPGAGGGRPGLIDGRGRRWGVDTGHAAPPVPTCESRRGLLDVRGRTSRGEPSSAPGNLIRPGSHSAVTSRVAGRGYV